MIQRTMYIAAVLRDLKRHGEQIFNGKKRTFLRSVVWYSLPFIYSILLFFTPEAT